MNDVGIEVEHVSKRFILSGGPGGTLKRAVIDLVKRGKPKTFTALNDVSFSVSRGETLGIIGSNGAGKSTLLSIIAGTMKPTEGSVRTHGIISSLLELGAGFHPDLTGRENVYLYGSIMNIPKAVMKKRFDDIVDFSGLHQFIDQPVRFYSSGMYVRLGFAVAVQVDPDILLIDEVLAVGDVDFQRRCLEKMDEFRKLGKTLLIISHDMNTIRSVSDKILFLDHGKLMGLGDPSDLVMEYEAAVQREREKLMKHEWGVGGAKIVSAEFVDPEAPAATGKFQILVEYKADSRIETPVFGFAVRDSEGRTVFGSNTQIEHFDIPFIEGEGKILLGLDLSALAGGNYMVSFSLHSSDHKTNYHRLEQSLPLHLKKHYEFDGVATFPVTWQRPKA